MSDITPGDGAIRRPGLYGSSIENTYAGVLSFLRRRYSRDLAGADVVEVSPAYDQSDITALAAAHIALDLLCVMRNQKLGV